MSTSFLDISSNLGRAQNDLPKHLSSRLKPKHVQNFCSVCVEVPSPTAPPLPSYMHACLPACLTKFHNGMHVE